MQIKFDVTAYGRRVGRYPRDRQLVGGDFATVTVVVT